MNRSERTCVRSGSRVRHDVELQASLAHCNRIDNMQTGRTRKAHARNKSKWERQMGAMQIARELLECEREMKTASRRRRKTKMDTYVANLDGLANEAGPSSRKHFRKLLKVRAEPGPANNIRRLSATSLRLKQRRKPNDANLRHTATSDLKGARSKCRQSGGPPEQGHSSNLTGQFIDSASSASIPECANRLHQARKLRAFNSQQKIINQHKADFEGLVKKYAKSASAHELKMTMSYTTKLEQVSCCQDGQARESVGPSSKSASQSTEDQRQHSKCRSKRGVAREPKRTIAAHFQESLFSKRPNWQTDLAESEASSEYDDDFDEAVCNRDDCSEANVMKSELDPNCDKSRCRLKLLKTKCFEESNDNILAELSGFGDGVAHYETSSHDADRPATPRLKKDTKRAVREAKAIRLSEGRLSYKNELEVPSKKCTLSETGHAIATGCSNKHAENSPFFAYLPLTPSSGVSCSFGTSMTSSMDSEAAQRRPITMFEQRPAADKATKSSGRRKSACEALKIESLKFLIAKNLVATLIGTYILVSLFIIVVLMLPYLFDTRRLHDNPTRLDEQTAVLQEPASGSESRGTQTSDESRVSQVPTIRPSGEPKRRQTQQNAQLNVSRHDKKKKRIATRLHQMKADAKAEETEDFKELWRVVHRGQCQPLKLSFCNRSIQSMMPPSVAETRSRSMGRDDFQMSYDKTLLPNQFTLATQPQVERAFELFQPLVDVQCYPLMPLFLCSIYAPKCIELNSSSLSANDLISARDDQQSPAREIKFASDFLNRLFSFPGKPQASDNSSQATFARIIPPCKSICKEALRRCTFFLEVLSMQLFDDCENLPDSDDENVCAGHRENLLLQQVSENKKCQDEQFRCSDGDCIPVKWRCDGFVDCKDKSDEEKCSKCEQEGQFYCGHDACINKERVCDGQIDCRDGRDERLCLRLAGLDRNLTISRPNNNTRARQEPRRLEVWNATTTSWSPVCGAHWQAMPMSHEACKALGYDRANETLILFGQARDPKDSSRSRAVGGSGRSEAARVRRSPPLMLDHHVTYERQTQTHKVPDTAASLPQAKSFDSLGDLLRLGAQTGCAAESAYSSSTVHLSCLDFQCGQSVTSYLSRQDSDDAWRLSGDNQSGPNLVRPKSDFGGGNPELAVKSAAASNSASEVGLVGASAEVFADGNVEDESPDEAPASVENGLAANGSISAHFETQPSPVSARLVVGGTESMPGEFPYLAALHGGPNEVFFCGGVLISPNWLLTAAHCVGNRTRSDGWMVKVGVTRRIASPAFVRKLQVRKIIKHQHFNLGTHLNNDIALILLDQRVDFNQYLRPICLPQANLRLGPDNSKDCVVVGFGKSRFAQDASYLHVAHFASVPIIHRSVCSKWYAEQDVNISDGMLCAGYSEGKRDACQGDSGSGLFCRRPNTNQFFVAGLVSFGVQCAKPKLPGVYSSIPHYVDWIHKTTREHGFSMA